MEKIEKGTIIEIKVPNVEKPIKAVVLDIIEQGGGDNYAEYVYILYAHKRLFKASNSCHWGIDIHYDENDTFVEKVEYEDWSAFHYEGIIVDYCEIPSISSAI